MNTLLCCIGRLENAYIREFVEYYKKLGFTHIELYDNNRDGEEDFRDVIGNFIDDGYVSLINYRNRINCQFDAYQNCYNKNNKNYDWLAFFDIDEFLTLEGFETIDAFLSQPIYKPYDVIHVNWMCYSDNGLVHKDNRGVLERFASPVLPYEKIIGLSFPENYHTKSIIRGGVNGITFNVNPHTVSGAKRHCDSTGKWMSTNDGFFCTFTPFKFDVAYLKHFSTKTAEEYAEKMRRGFPDRKYSELPIEEIKALIATRFFRYNEVTDEKIQIFTDAFGFTKDDLSRFV